MRNNSATSSASRLDVGSSSTSTRTSTATARAIATSCCTARGWLDNTESGSMLRPMRCSSSLARARVARVSIAPRVRGSRPRRMFSATVKFGQRLTSWYTVPIPAC